MNYEFMLADTPLPPCLPLSKAAVQLPISSTAKVLYACLLDEIIAEGIEDSNGIMYIEFPDHGTGNCYLPQSHDCEAYYNFENRKMAKFGEDL